MLAKLCRFNILIVWILHHGQVYTGVCMSNPKIMSHCRVHCVHKFSAADCTYLLWSLWCQLGIQYIPPCSQVETMRCLQCWQNFADLTSLLVCILQHGQVYTGVCMKITLQSRVVRLSKSDSILTLYMCLCIS